MSECLFCKIRDGEIPGDIVYENDRILAFNDINPVAPTHILIIPKEHISTLNDLEKNHTQTMGELFLVAKEIASKEGLSESGYRTIFNCNEHGQQTVFHIHLHLIHHHQTIHPADLLLKYLQLPYTAFLHDIQYLNDHNFGFSNPIL